MANLIINTDIDMLYPVPARELKAYELPALCPTCGKPEIGDYGPKFHPRYGCEECGAMFDLVEIKTAALQKKQ
jgi:hypothetical protein